MAALIPGLKVKAEGVYNEQRQVLATKINFKGDPLEDAQKIKQELERQNAELLAQKEALGKAAGALN